MRILSETEIDQISGGTNDNSGLGILTADSAPGFDNSHGLPGAGLGVGSGNGGGGTSNAAVKSGPDFPG
ncbi:MAG: hypothetical protein JO212_03720, partial [Acetobacteraceae bacterium]|nr:hypothetical protein [Acetobacteraceae bacterium]